jgi:glutathione peroxidase
MNELMDLYGSKGFSVLGFPCNQFGHQENLKDSEIISSLKYVRPGSGYVPKLDMFVKCDVNGSNQHPVFEWLKDQLHHPSDEQLMIMTDPKLVTWSPVRRYDISWNFEKFLVNRKGQAVHRFSPRFQTTDLKTYIEQLLEETSS